MCPLSRYWCHCCMCALGQRTHHVIVLFGGGGTKPFYSCLPICPKPLSSQFFISKLNYFSVSLFLLNPIFLPSLSVINCGSLPFQHLSFRQVQLSFISSVFISLGQLSFCWISYHFITLSYHFIRFSYPIIE